MTARILLASLVHETNSFNRVLTPLDSFRGRYLCLDDASARERLAGSGTEMGGFIAACADRGWESRIAFAASAGPSGPMEERVFQDFRNMLFEAARAMRPDGVLIALHGAMTTEHGPDPEGDIAAGLREIVGPETPIVVTLDMHANIGPALVEAVDALCISETYPHVDQAEKGTRAADALARLLSFPRNGRRLTRALMMRPPMLDAADHGRTQPPGPMNAILARQRSLRKADGLITCAMSIGFTWADTPRAGPAVVLHAEAGSELDLSPIARELTQALWDSRHQTLLDYPSPAEAVARAREAGSGPIVLADFADNPAGGAYGDSPNLLRFMVAADLDNAVFASLHDPRNAAAAHAAGVGARLTLDLGGWNDPSVTPPLRLDVEVERLHSGSIRFDGPFLRGVMVEMGPTAVLRHRAIRIVVASRALAITDLQQFLALGIDPVAQSVIALKSRNHHRAAFGPIAREVILVDAGGIASTDFAAIPYARLKRPIWPLDLDSSLEHLTVLEFRDDD